jgi:hypothetical protein
VLSAFRYPSSLSFCSDIFFHFLEMIYFILTFNNHVSRSSHRGFAWQIGGVDHARSSALRIIGTRERALARLAAHFSSMDRIGAI